MVAATVRTEQPAPEHIITQSPSSSIFCVPIHPFFVFVFSAYLLPHFLQLNSLCFSFFWLIGLLLFLFSVSFFHLRSRIMSVLITSCLPTLWLAVVLFWERWITVVAAWRAEKPNGRCSLEHWRKWGEGWVVGTASVNGIITLQPPPPLAQLGVRET